MPLPVVLLGDESKPDNAIRKIVDTAITIIQLESAPTTAGKQLPLNNNAGFYGGKLYVNHNGTVYEYSGTPV